jgi:hypothetical protein
VLQRTEAVVELQLVSEAPEQPLEFAEFVAQLVGLIRMAIDKISCFNIEIKVYTWTKAKLQRSCSFFVLFFSVTFCALKTPEPSSR